MRTPFVDIDRIFDLHPPTAEQGERMGRLRAVAKGYATMIIDLTPGCPEQTKAIGYLDQALREAIAAIAREG